MQDHAPEDHVSMGLPHIIRQTLARIPAAEPNS